MKTMTDVSTVSTREARLAFVLARDEGKCQVRTAGCLGDATETMLDPAWFAHGADDSPVHALRAVCAKCRERWAH